MIKKLVLILFFLACALSEAHASEDKFKYPFYVGFTGGYGSTTWNGLVPSNEKQNPAINLSTPISVDEGGDVWGFFVGYELLPVFALEANYTRYPDAEVNFDPESLFSFDHDGLTQFTTRTESIGLMAKLMMIIPHTTFRAFSSAGVADVHRKDMLIDRWHIGPTFGLGLNYNLNEHIMAEVGVNYVAGYGESELDPSYDYVPFVYSVFLHLAYRF